MLLIINPIVVAKSLTNLYGFLPFKAARPVLKLFFRVFKERSEFNLAFAQIVKAEAVSKQLTQLKQVCSGTEYDGRNCAKCRKPLGLGDAFAAPCGHVFHGVCSSDGWCPICGNGFSQKSAEFLTNNEQTALTKFDMKQNVNNKLQDSNIKPAIPLAKPALI